jgi:hydroxyacylglutathione hydrolase
MNNSEIKSRTNPRRTYFRLSKSSKNNLLKLLIWLIIGVLFIIISGTVYYFYELNADERISFKISRDIIQINDLAASMYLVKTDSGYIAIDAGFNPAFLREALEYNSINENEIKAVFLTHLDIDHRAGLDVLKYAIVYLPKIESTRIDGLDRFNFLNPFIFSSIRINKFNTLVDNEELKISNRTIKCIALPGHTKGSMGFLIDGKYLFIGDAFRIKNGKLAVPYKKLLVDDVKEMKNSIRKTAELKGVQYVFTAHSGFTGDFDFAVSDWRTP